MVKADLIPQIRKCWIYAQALHLGESFSGPTAFEPTDRFKKLSLSPDVTYEEVYLSGLRDSEYNILLTDFSFFQFGVGSVGGVRFAYYPNPFIGAAPEAVAELKETQEYVSEGIIDVDEFLHRASEIRHPQHPPLVRYEYSKQQYVALTHPCSHIHFGFHSENRWPVKRYLTAHAFALLVFRLFYLDFWLRADQIKIGDSELTLDLVLQMARADCRILYDEEFSEVESQRFHLI